MTNLEAVFSILTPLLALTAMALSVWFIRSVKRQLGEYQQSQLLLQQDLRSLCNAAVQVGERVNRMEQELKSLHQRQNDLGVRQDKLAQSEPGEMSFEQAIKMALKGASTEELIDICNISRGEAELITMMHRLDSKR